jgi:predicted permease
VLWAEQFAQDLWVGLRALRRAPAFALTVILVLALGTGANTSIYALLDRLLVQPAAVAGPESLVLLRRGDLQSTFPHAEALEFQRRARTVTGIATVMPFESDLAVAERAAVITAEAVSGNYGAVLRPGTLLGRWFDTDADPVAVISASVWERWFERDPNVLGRLVRSGTQTYTVVGVASAEFPGVFAPLRTDLWIPADVWWGQPSPVRRAEAQRPSVMLFARLQPDATTASATAELRVIDRQLLSEGVRPAAPAEPILVEQVRGVWQPAMRRTSRAAVTMLGIVAGLVLALACVNVGNLLLVRGAARQRETAVRNALGAGRWRLFRQSLTETLVLSLLSAASGVGVAWATNRLLGALIPTLPFAFPFQLDLAINGRTLAYAVAAALLTTLVCGLVPAWRVARASSLPALKGELVSGAQIRGRTVATVVQVVVSLVLLLTAGAFIREVGRLQDLDPGFRFDKTVYATTFVADPAATAESRRLVYANVLDRLRARPDVANVSLTFLLPMSPGPGVCLRHPDGGEREATSSVIDEGFLATMGIALVNGRDFSARDAASNAPVVIVNETLARQFWPTGGVVGQRLAIDCESPEQAEVIGVARDTMVRALGAPAEPHVYRPWAQRAAGLTTVVVETRVPPAQMVQPLRSALQAVGEPLRVYEVETVADHVTRSFWGVEWASRVLGVFAAVALGLAVLGLYGVVAYRVERRTREIGVRLALGADPRRIVGEVVAHGVTLTAIGLVIGGGFSLVVGQFLARSQLAVSPPDLVTYLVVVTAWVLATLLACYVPARRAARVDPVETLRAE